MSTEPSKNRAMELAATVIRWSSRESPADHVLRAELKKARGLNRATSHLVARLVFAYFRWLGWIEGAQAIESRLDRALNLQKRFDNDPGSFSDEELLARAVPAWTKDVVDMSTGWVRALQEEPLVWIRAKPGMAASVVEQLPDTSAGPVSDALSYRGDEDLFMHPGFHEGEFEIQDLASQIVGHLCDPKRGETWWDACAGEGGKTMHLSGLMQNKGLIWASDRADWRLARLKRRAARAQVFNYRTAIWNGGPQLPTKTKFDGVLIDAPCSGIGTWQRNPHARWTVTRGDVSELGALQARLLDHVGPSVKPNGRLIYSVCTLAREETTAVVQHFNAAHPEFRLERPVAAWLPADSNPEVWLWPQDWKANGMFIAQWRKS